MQELTPAGRGQVISHNLYKEREVGELKARFAGHTGGGGSSEESERPAPSHSPAPRSSSPPAPSSLTADMFAELRLEVAELRGEVARLRQDVRDLQDRIG